MKQYKLEKYSNKKYGCTGEQVEKIFKSLLDDSKNGFWIVRDVELNNQKNIFCEKNNIRNMN